MRLCPVCSQPPASKLGELANTKVAPLARSRYDLVHCRQCDVVYLSPLPSERDLEILYVDELQFDYHNEESSRRVVGFISSRLRAVMKYIGVAAKPTLLRRNPKPLSVLEIGAGLAWISRAAKAISPRALTVAQDITAEAAEKCPWVDRYLVGST